VSARRPDPPDALLLDEMFSPTIAELLAKRGVDCQAVVARAVLRSRDDAEVFEAAVREARILVTNNVVDFEILRRRAVADGREVPGLISTSDTVSRDGAPSSHNWLMHSNTLPGATRSRPKAESCGFVHPVDRPGPRRQDRPNADLTRTRDCRV
jgi:hypothetical protein